MLSFEESLRYNRHIRMKEIGLEGQLKLKAAKVLIVGMGGLGCPAGLYLAAAGVGKIGLVDYDRVELSNLQRQVLYNSEDIGKFKVLCAKARLAQVNPHIEIQAYPEELTAANARTLISSYDIVLDGTDNFATRYLINDMCLELSKPMIYGSVFQFEGQVSVFNHNHGPCYRCVFPEMPPAGLIPNCAENGVLGVIPGLVGALQASETIQVVLGLAKDASARLHCLNGLGLEMRSIELQKRKGCGCSKWRTRQGSNL